MNWDNAIEKWKIRGCHVLDAAPPEAIAAAENFVGPLPDALRSFYQNCNGFNFHWFIVLPVEDTTDIKKTWDGLLRANRPSSNSFFGDDEKLRKRFLVFAKLDVGRIAAMERGDASIWFEEEGELHQTDLSLAGFIETMLREVEEL